MQNLDESEESDDARAHLGKNTRISACILRLFAKHYILDYFLYLVNFYCIRKKRWEYRTPSLAFRMNYKCTDVKLSPKLFARIIGLRANTTFSIWLQNLAIRIEYPISVILQNSCRVKYTEQYLKLVSKHIFSRFLLFWNWTLHSQL